MSDVFRSILKDQTFPDLNKLLIYLSRDFSKFKIFSDVKSNSILF